MTGTRIAAGLLLLTIVAVAHADIRVNTSKGGRPERGSGTMTTEVREIDSFVWITTDAPVELYVTRAEGWSLSVTVDDNLHDHIVTEVRRGDLFIETEGSFRTRGPIRIDITVPMLEGLALEGAGDAYLIDVADDEFLIDLQGSGDVTVEGNAAFLEIALDGSGDVDASDFRAATVIATLNGSGDIICFATERFEGTVNGSGDIVYRGRPDQHRHSINGSGDIARR